MSIEAQGAVGQIPDEDQARANCYALIGRLFHEGPDASLLAQIWGHDTVSAAPESGSELSRTWRVMQSSCKRTAPNLVAQEYDSLFVSVGRAPVSLYTTSYMDHAAAAKHLVALRQKLGAFGLARRAMVFVVEDHISALCDAMRFLVEQNQPLVEQKSFFEQFIYPGAVPLCDAVENAGSASFYKSVAAFGRAFLELEKQAFDMTA